MEVSLTSTGEGKVVAHEESSSSEASSTSKVVEEHGVTKQIQESSQKEEHSLMEQRVSESVSSSTKMSTQSFSSVSQSVSSSTSISSSSLNSSSVQMSEEALKLLQSAEEQKKASEAPLDNNGNQVDQHKQTNGIECNGVQEIQQENIRNTLHEIINEIETETSKDANKENQQTQGQQNGGTAETNGKLTEEQDEAYVPKKIDLEKLFTPASDSGEITPQQRNRKLFSSSSFYAACHPTVQEQVQLAHRISASLYDTSNQQSKGHSMYVNRMKRSVKWVHESQGQSEDASGRGEGQRPATPTTADVMGNYKIPSKEVNLSLVMNPHGQIHDINSLRKQGLKIEPTQINPEVCFDLVKDLNSPCGKGAELFAKRRKRAEKWVVDENNVQKQLQEAQAAARASPKLPPPSVIDQGRVQREQEMANIQEKYVQPRIKMVQSPWEAALQTGSVNNAFQEIKRAPPTHQQVLDTVVQRASEQQTTTLSTSSSTLSQQKQMTFQTNTLPPQTRSFQAPSPLPTRAYAPSPTPSGLTYSQQFSQTPQPSPAFKQPLPPTPKTPYNPPPALTSRVNVDALLKPRLPRAWDPNAFNSLPRNFGSTVAPIPRVAAQPERQPVQPAYVSQQEPASNLPAPPFQPQTNETPAALPNYTFSPIPSTPAPRPFTPQTLPQVPQPQSEFEIRKRMEEIKTEIATKAEQFQTKKEESTTVISQQESVKQEIVQEQQIVQQSEQQIVQQSEQQIIQQTEQQVVQESTTVSSSEQTFIEQKTESSVVATQEVVQQTAEEPPRDIPVQDAAPATEAQVPAPEPQPAVLEETAPTPAQAPAEPQVVEAAVPEQTQPEVVQEPVAQQPIAEQPARFDQQPVETEGEAPFTGVEKLEEIIRQEAQLQQFQQESISQETIRQESQSEQSITQQSFSQQQQQSFSQQQQSFSQQETYSQQQQSFSQQQTFSQQQQQQTISQETYSSQQQFVEQQQQIQQFEQQRQQVIDQQNQQLLASQQLLQNQVLAQQQAFARQQIADTIAQQQEGDEYEKIPVKQLIQTFDPNHVYQPKPIKKQPPPEPVIQSDQQLPDYLHAQQPTNFSIQYTQPQGIYFVADTCCETRQFFEEEQNLLQQQQQQQYMYEQQQQQLAYEQQLQSYQYQQSLQQQQQYQYEQQQQSLEAYQIESSSSYSQQQESQLQYQYQQQQTEQITRNQTFSQAKDIINQIEQQTRQQSALQQKGLQSGSGANQVVVDEAQVTQSSSESAERLRQQIQSGNNYNTAARGWGKQFDFYRPVTFNAKSVIA